MSIHKICTGKCTTALPPVSSPVATPIPANRCSVLAEKAILYGICGALAAFLMLCGVSCRLKPLPGGEQKFQQLFNGRDLEGWKGDPMYWRVENGIMIGEVTPSTLLKRNSFIIKDGLITADFELKVMYRVSAHGNSGINYRSVPLDSVPHALAGYQADIDGEGLWSGQNYEERGRTFLALRGERVTIEAGFRADAYPAVRERLLSNAAADSLLRYIHRNAWNEYHLVARGPRMQHYINGVLMSEVVDRDTVHARLSGMLGVQVHVGPPMKIEFKDFRYRELNAD